MHYGVLRLSGCETLEWQKLSDIQLMKFIESLSNGQRKITSSDEWSLTWSKRRLCRSAHTETHGFPIACAFPICITLFHDLFCACKPFQGIGIIGIHQHQDVKFYSVYRSEYAWAGYRKVIRGDSPRAWALLEPACATDPAKILQKDWQAMDMASNTQLLSYKLVRCYSITSSSLQRWRS